MDGADSSSDEFFAIFEVEVVFLWSQSSALTSPPTTQVQQMIREGNFDEDEDDSSSEEVLAIFVRCFYVILYCHVQEDLEDSEGSTSGDSSSSEEVFVVSLFVHDILVSQSCSGVVES